jgi:hypothetical protein
MEPNKCSRCITWNRGKIVSQKAPLKVKEAHLFVFVNPPGARGRGARLRVPMER